MFMDFMLCPRTKQNEPCFSAMTLFFIHLLLLCITHVLHLFGDSVKSIIIAGSDPATTSYETKQIMKWTNNLLLSLFRAITPKATWNRRRGQNAQMNFCLHTCSPCWMGVHIRLVRLLLTIFIYFSKYNESFTCFIFVRYFCLRSEPLQLDSTFDEAFLHWRKVQKHLRKINNQFGFRHKNLCIV